jgi:L1 cell adhesion molecule like protein
MARLRKACEKAKCELSSQLETSIQIDSLYAGLDFYYPLKRNDVTEVCKDLFRSVLEPIERVLRDGKLDKSSLHEIALLGGSSRIVPIQELLAEIFPGKLISKILNPVESPARGVALQAAKCTRDGDVRPLNEMLLLNVYPFPLGFDKGDGLMEVLLRRNTTIPTKKTYRYSTWQDNQGSFYLTALEGFRARPKDNNKLGQLAIPVPINPRGVPQIDVTYDVDAQGRLAVELKDVNTGVTGKMTLQDYDRLKPDEIEQMQLEAEKLDASDQLEIHRQEVKIALEGNAIKFKNRLLDGNLSNSMPFWRVCGILAWLEENEHADTAKLESKQAELQKLATFVERRSTPRVYADQSATTDSTKVESMHELPGVESPKPETFDFLRENPHFDQFRHHVQQVPNMLERLLAEIAKINPPMAQLIADHDEEFLQLLAEDHPIRSYPNSDVDIAAWADIRVPINLGSGGREPESVSAVVDRWIKSAVKEVPTSGSSRNVPVSEEPSLNAPTSSTTGTTPEPPTKGPTSAPRAAYVEDYNSEDASQSLGVQPNVSDQRDAAAPSSTQPSIHAAIPPEPTTRTEPEASTSGSETVSSEVGLGDIFTSPSTGSNRTQYSDAEFNQIATYLRNTGRPAWSLVPRLYTVLRVIGQLPFLDRFIEQGITDIFFPFTTASLPAVMTPSSRASFLQIQTAVLSKSLKFEKSSERRHALFGPGEPLPFEVVGRLGAGAHGSVDKVVSPRPVL